MFKKPLNKRRATFLEDAFPENPLPFKKLNRKAFKSLKSSNPRGFTNRIKRVENRIIKREIALQRLKENGRLTLDTSTLWGFLIKGKKCLSNLVQQRREGRGAGLGLAKKRDLRSSTQAKTRLKYVFSLQQILASFYNKQSSYKKSSKFKNLLKERKRLSLIYGGLNEKQIQRLALQAKGVDGKFDDNFVKIVERRLDVVLFRICFFPTIFSAKQWINHKHILVNNSSVTLPGYQLSPGDIITLAPERKSQLKKIISFFVAKRIKLRSRHYCFHLSSFYNLVKKASRRMIARRIIRAKSLFYNKNLFKNLPNNKTLQKISGVLKILPPQARLPSLRTSSLKSFLKLRNLFTTARSLTQRVKALRISSQKPLNLEVCYKNMVAVFLYSPQKVALPTSVDLHAIQP